ncbi:MAG: hypothetical protein HFG83_10485 [Dorea sp.]|jgi:hypothetical protein|nr:hypothetical protein [Dorea sp.]MCI9454237.1 hypothetical protein [Dorea sp.]
MKKVLYIISDLLIAALLAGAYIVQYFAKRKLGMNRWIVFKISKVKEALPIEMLRYVAVAAVLALAVLVLLLYGRNRKAYQKIVLPMVIVTIVLAAGYLGFTLYFSQERVRAYYLMLPLIGLANVVQLAKTFTAMKLCKVNEP